MVETLIFDNDHSVHIRSRPVFKDYFPADDSFDENNFGAIVIIDYSFGDNLFSGQFNFFAYKIHNTNLEFVLSISQVLQVSKMNKTLLLVLKIERISLKLSLEFQDAEFILLIVWFPPELYVVHLECL